jgi:hypothetical protein
MRSVVLKAVMRRKGGLEAAVHFAQRGIVPRLEFGHFAGLT